MRGTIKTPIGAALPQRRRSAPIVKSEAIIELVLESVSAGTPLAEVCRQDWAPCASTWYNWLNEDQELDGRFARARESGQSAIEAHNQLVARGEPGYSTGDVKRDRLIVDVANRMLDRWDRRYSTAEGDASQSVAELMSEWVDPRTGYYFHDLEMRQAFGLAVIFARIERREGAGSGIFTSFLEKNGFPDLDTCEAVIAGTERRIPPSPVKSPEQGKAEFDASDLA